MIFQIQVTDEFKTWFNVLPDRAASARVQARIDRAAAGNFGDHKGIGKGVSEMRIKIGPGYRVYGRGQTIVVLFAGGDKSTQALNTKLAHRLACTISERAQS